MEGRPTKYFLVVDEKSYKILLSSLIHIKQEEIKEKEKEIKYLDLLYDDCFL
jgi:hypothetical protein